MARRGQPTILTPETEALIVEAVRNGNYLCAAAAKAGTSYRVMRTWMVRGKKARSGIFHHFYHAVRQAEADAESAIVKQWRAQIPENWQAARDFLARRFPKRWGPLDKHAATDSAGNDLPPVTVIEIVRPAPKLLEDKSGEAAP